MRILFLSPVHPLLARRKNEALPRWQMQTSWVGGLESLGHEIEVVKYTPDDGRARGWPGRIKGNMRVIREIRAIGGADLIIYSLGADVLVPSVVYLIKQVTRAPLVVLSGVSPMVDGNPRERAMASLIDLAATNDESHAREWRKLGAKRAVCLPISAVDPKLHYPRKVKKDIDVLFAGTVTGRRKLFFNKLKSQLPTGISLVVRHHVWEEEYARLVSRAKIGLNPIRPEMARGANLRMFEIPAFGALQLSSFGNRKWLTPGEEMLVYRDLDGAAELIAEYLEKEKERGRIINRAKKRVLVEHTFKHRAKKLLKLI